MFAIRLTTAHEFGQVADEEGPGTVLAASSVWAKFPPAHCLLDALDPVVAAELGRCCDGDDGGVQDGVGGGLAHGQPTVAGAIRARHQTLAPCRRKNVLRPPASLNHSPRMLCAANRACISLSVVMSPGMFAKRTSFVGWPT